MKHKLKNHFLNLGPKRFVIGTVCLLFVLDLLNSCYLRLYWASKDLSLLYIRQIAATKGWTMAELGPESILEIKGVVDNAVFFFLFIVLLNNIFFYIFYLRKKLWAQGYILFYTLTNSILAILFLVEGPILGMGWFLYNLSTMFIYLYLYFGIKMLKYETTDAIPANEKKAQ